jgi:hypothetical protein
VETLIGADEGAWNPSLSGKIGTVTYYRVAITSTTA